MNTQMAEKVGTAGGFIAALDQSGGSTPKALRGYGISDDAYSTEDQMFDLMHAMRARIIKAPAFTGDKVLGAILFEMTMDRDIDGVPTAEYLWNTKQVVPFLKIDKGLMDEENGVQLLKPMPGLDDLLARAAAKGIFGTKERSVINAANPVGIKAIVDQQFEVAEQVLAAGLIPILEPEITITIADKVEAEAMLKAEILKHLDAMPEDKQVMLKLSLPSTDNVYADLIAHPRVLRVVALSGGYSRDEANIILTRQNGMIASFSRGLAEGISAQQPEDDYNATIANAIDSIYTASIT